MPYLSALEMCSRQGAIQIPFTLPYLTFLSAAAASIYFSAAAAFGGVMMTSNCHNMRTERGSIGYILFKKAIGYRVRSTTLSISLISHGRIVYVVLLLRFVTL